MRKFKTINHISNKDGASIEVGKVVTEDELNPLGVERLLKRGSIVVTDEKTDAELAAEAKPATEDAPAENQPAAAGNAARNRNK